MKQWLLEKLLEYIMASLTKDKIEELLKQLDAWAKPLIMAKKQELYDWIDEQVVDTKTPIDDAIGQIVKNAIDYYLK